MPLLWLLLRQERSLHNFLFFMFFHVQICSASLCSSIFYLPFLLFFFIFFYLICTWKSESQSSRKRDREIFPPLIHSRKPELTHLKTGDSCRSPTCVQKPEDWAILCWFPRYKQEAGLEWSSQDINTCVYAGVAVRLKTTVPTHSCQCFYLSMSFVK